MGYNIQNQTDLDSRKKLILESFQTFLESPVERTLIHLTLAEAKWIEKRFPQITLSLRQNSKKVHGRDCYVVAKKHLVKVE